MNNFGLTRHHSPRLVSGVLRKLGWISVTPSAASFRWRSRPSAPSPPARPAKGRSRQRQCQRRHQRRNSLTSNLLGSTTIGIDCRNFFEFVEEGGHSSTGKKRPSRAVLPRNPSASAESASASCRAVSGGGRGILRLCTPVAGSRSIHGCAGALGSLAAARAVTNCAPTCIRASHGSGPESLRGIADPFERAISPAPISASAFASSAGPDRRQRQRCSRPPPPASRPRFRPCAR